MPKPKTSVHIQCRLNSDDPIESVALANYQRALAEGNLTPRKLLAGLLYQLEPLRVDSQAELIAQMTANAVASRIEAQLRDQARLFLDAIRDMGYRVVVSDGSADEVSIDDDDEALNELLDSMSKRMSGGML